MTLAVAAILNAFLEGMGQAQYGYKLMTETGFSSAKVYQILARLVTAGWLIRHDDPDASPASGGPPRITYTLRPEAVPRARRAVTTARAPLEAAPQKRRFTLPGFQPGVVTGWDT